MCDSHDNLSDDHVALGKALDLFHLGSDPAGMVFWHPAGLKIVQRLEALWRESMHAWLEVRSPVLYGADIWRRSGHLDKFAANMYLLEHGGSQYGLKPMNCPAHLAIYSERPRSYRELPLRYCELGNVHRAESAGAIRGLLRVRSFVQDDGHILCSDEQVMEEAIGCLQIAKAIYQRFGLPFRAELSLRPKEHFGSDELWDRSEQQLRDALSSAGIEYEERSGEGAFYGPKIDLHAQDRLERWWQLGSVQLDYVLPERFGCVYRDEHNQLAVPVMIHRAAFGSLERFVGILLEHYDRDLPLWLAPRQIAVLPVGADQAEYAHEVAAQLRRAGFAADVSADGSLGSRIAQAHELAYFDSWVIGKREAAAGSVSSRRWSEAPALEAAIARLAIERDVSIE